MALARFGDFSSFVKFASFSAIGGITTYYLVNARQKKKLSGNDVLVTTGCDSGLGYSIAVHCHNDLNSTVVACVRDFNSKGAMKLKTMFAGSERFHMVKLEVREKESVHKALTFVEDLLGKNKELSKCRRCRNHLNQLKFSNLCRVHRFDQHRRRDVLRGDRVANQSDRRAADRRESVGHHPSHEGIPPDGPPVQIEDHHRDGKNVRRLHCRFNSTWYFQSHCALRALPGLAAYSASKAGLAAFTEGLRQEMGKYGVDVVDFIPGSFVASSNIAVNQSKQFSEMRGAFSEEQLGFYGEFFDRYAKYLEPLSVGDGKEPEMLDKNIIETFDEALLDDPPKVRYVCEPILYTMFHSMFKLTPRPLTDWLIVKFLRMPEYDPSKSKS